MPLHHMMLFSYLQPIKFFQAQTSCTGLITTTPFYWLILNMCMRFAVDETSLAVNRKTASYDHRQIFLGKLKNKKSRQIWKNMTFDKI